MASLTGLTSGIDTAALVSSLTAAERQNVTNVEAKKSAQQAKQKQITTLSDKLKTLQTKAQTLSQQSKLTTPKGSSTNEDVVTISASGQASQGSYDVRVAALAKAERSYSTSFAAKDAAGLFGTGTLQIAVGSNSVDIAVTSDDTLESLAGKINSATGDVQASVFNTGSGYRLQVVGQKTGTTNGITFNETGTSLGLSAPQAEVVTASDAKVSIDGFVVTSASNSISDVMSGISLELKGVTEDAVYDSGTNSISGGSATSIDIKKDTASLKTSINDFVTSYNDVMTNLNTLNGTSPDPTLLSVTQKLRTALSSTVSGLSSNLDSLAEIGIATNKDSTIRLDSAVFDKRASDDFQGVVNLFATVGTRKGVGDVFRSAIDDLTRTGTGVLAAKTDALAAATKRFSEQITKMNARIDANEARLKKQFAAMEQAISKMNQSSGSLGSL
jgi:flagellar hook-associated protein 2